AAGGFDLDRLGAAQPNPVGDQCAQVLLPVKRAGKHVADEHAVHPLAAGIRQGGQDSLAGQLAQGFVPLFRNNSLTNTNDGNFAHSFGLLNSDSNCTNSHGLSEWSLNSHTAIARYYGKMGQLSPMIRVRTARFTASQRGFRAAFGPMRHAMRAEGALVPQQG